MHLVEFRVIQPAVEKWQVFLWSRKDAKGRRRKGGCMFPAAVFVPANSEKDRIFCLNSFLINHVSYGIIISTPMFGVER